uniref:Bm13364 n=1 Tax=Brugia malayi TaxID=6279 RepID=A0A1I9G012_BRUMA|nr:Bm13364 [Brugia malayi]
MLICWFNYPNLRQNKISGSQYIPRQLRIITPPLRIPEPNHGKQQFKTEERTGKGTEFALKKWNL